MGKLISLISFGNYSTKEIKSCETFSFFITMGENITTDIGGFIEKFFVNDSLYITNTFNKNYLNLVGGLAGNINNPRYKIKRLNISDW